MHALLNRIRFFKDLQRRDHKPAFGGLELFKYIGPGLLVTVGFIDPGNWASNLAAGADYGYTLLWMVTLSTVILIILQHNVARLGIASGYCLSEAAATYLNPCHSKIILGSAMLASVSTSLAEILGGAIALNMLFRIPLKAGALLVLALVILLIFSSTYRRLEKWIIICVSIIGLSFIYELGLVPMDWRQAAAAWRTPSFPKGSMIIIMSVLGAVVMPHNLFLHSEVIQSRQWNLQDPAIIRKQLKFEFVDTLFSMIVGWAINSAMILLAAATFFAAKIPVTELPQAHQMLEPLLGESAAVIFAVALLFSGIASTITSGMAAGTIMAGIYKEPYDIKDSHSRLGVMVSLVTATAIIFLISNPFQGLVISQMLLSMQLPITIFLQLYLTSSQRVMGAYRNNPATRVSLYAVGAVVTALNGALLVSFLF